MMSGGRCGRFLTDYKILTKCVNKQYTTTKSLTKRWLNEIIAQYRDDIVKDEVERAILCSDLEAFLKYNYPMLRLRSISEEKGHQKLFIMTSMLLFHCCVCSHTGRVEHDLCVNLKRAENEIILYFCKFLNVMEITISNVLVAIEKAIIYAERRSRDAKQPTSFTSIESFDLDTSGCESFTANETQQIDSKHAKTISTAVLPSTSVTVMPCYVTDGPSFSQATFDENLGYKDDEVSESQEGVINVCNKKNQSKKEKKNKPKTEKKKSIKSRKEEQKPKVKETNKSKFATEQPYCSSAKIITTGNNRMHRKRSLFEMDNSSRGHQFKMPATLKWITVAFFIILCVCTCAGMLLYVLNHHKQKTSTVPSAVDLTSVKTKKPELRRVPRMENPTVYHTSWAWQCQKGLCIKVFRPRNTTDSFAAHSRCILLCTGPQIWPLPIGATYFKKELVVFSTDKLEYKFHTVQSNALNQYLGQAFKYFLQNIDMLEHMNERMNRTNDANVKKLSIELDIQTDPDPRIRINTDESYYLTVNIIDNKLKIIATAPSFAGIKHGLETLTQMIFSDQATGYLITLSEVIIKDAPSYKYRGLMLDTARNFIPVPDILKTLDGMAACKLNTFHWRISDATSFPLVLESMPNLWKYGAYDKTMVYTKDDVSVIVNRAGVRAIRVLIEVAIPGPVGRAWSWFHHATCSNKTATCDIICTQLTMSGKLLQNLENMYAEIINMTRVDDIFHLSNNLFSLVNCSDVMEDREEFLERALAHLKKANKGFMPALPIIWYSPQLETNRERNVWFRYGVQVNKWPNNRQMSLNKYKVIHSSKWDLSCDMKKHRCTRYRSWQEMYAWRDWKNVESYTTEGGEAILWTDLVDSSNLDAHLWPRTAAVAERLWSDVVINATATGEVYLRLDYHRWRMLFLGTKVEPIWPMWCSFNPHVCMSKVRDMNTKK